MIKPQVMWSYDVRHKLKVGNYKELLKRNSIMNLVKTGIKLCSYKKEVVSLKVDTCNDIEKGNPWSVNRAIKLGFVIQARKGKDLVAKVG
ncbi:Uncharacterized protein TCM_017670 [Theobroma cacao]|uniref:Uncharacterized protein n=1 Tax=Theobroma cacao TaxID=3641 RepID=A0A061EEU5_THECC|nr:Uncharacterized protein TCM_017670 [Theobroma cacao]